MYGSLVFLRHIVIIGLLAIFGFGSASAKPKAVPCPGTTATPLWYRTPFTLGRMDGVSTNIQAICAPSVFGPVAVTSATISGMALWPDCAKDKVDELVVLCHGGFSPGTSMLRLAEKLAQQGRLVVVPDYRGTGGSSGAVEFAYGEVEDVRAAMRYACVELRTGKKPIKVKLVGISHGGANVLLAATKPSPFSFGLMDPIMALVDQGITVTHVVAVSAPSDMGKLYTYWDGLAGPAPGMTMPEFFLAKSLVALLSLKAGGTPAAAPSGYCARSPIAYASRADKKTKYLIIHGKKDSLVPPDNAAENEAALEKAGASVSVYTVLGMGHYPDEVQTEDYENVLLQFLK